MFSRVNIISCWQNNLSSRSTYSLNSGAFKRITPSSSAHGILFFLVFCVCSINGLLLEFRYKALCCITVNKCSREPLVLSVMESLNYNSMTQMIKLHLLRLFSQLLLQTSSHILVLDLNPSFEKPYYVARIEIETLRDVTTSLSVIYADASSTQNT